MTSLWTKHDVADFLKIPHRTVVDWAAKGVIPAGKLGKHWRFDPGLIRKWWEEHNASHDKNTTPVRVG